MWTKPTYNVKCPRTDCLYFKTAAGDFPCGGCTCNQWAKGVNKVFWYKPTRMPEKRKEEKDV